MESTPTLVSRSASPLGWPTWPVLAWICLAAGCGPGVEEGQRVPHFSKAPGELIWAERLNGIDPAINAECDAVAEARALPDKGFLLAGRFCQTLIIDEGLSTEAALVANGDQGKADGFLARFDQDGDLVWARSFGGPNQDTAMGLDLTDDGEAVVIGSFLGTAVFGKGEAGETTLMSAGVALEQDVYLATFSLASGDLRFVRQAGGETTEFGMDVVALPDSSGFLVLGFFEDSAVFGPGEPGQVTLVSAGYADLFLARYDSDGRIKWARREGGISGEYSGSLSLRPDGSFDVRCNFFGLSKVGTHTASPVMLLANGGMDDQDAFVAHYESDGSFGWVRSVGGPGLTWLESVDWLSDGGVLLLGWFYDSITLGKGEERETTLWSQSVHADIFLARLEPDGSLRWAKREGGFQSEMIKGPAAMADGSFIVAGTYGLSVDPAEAPLEERLATFGEDEANEITVAAEGGVGGDVFVAGYLGNGMLAKLWTANGPADDGARSIHILADNTLLLTGGMIETLSFGRPDGSSVELGPASGADMFLARYEAFLKQQE